MLTVGMAVVARARARRGCEQFFAEEMKKQVLKLQADRDNGKLPEIPPDSVMQEIMAHILELDEQLIELLKSPHIQAGDKQSLKKVAEEEISKLVAVYQWRDLERRIDWSEIDFTATAMEPSDSTSENSKSKIGRFVTSRFTVAFLDRGTRLMVATSMLLALLSTIGWMSLPAAKLAASEYDRLENLQAAFNAIDEVINSGPVAPLDEEKAKAALNSISNEMDQVDEVTAVAVKNIGQLDQRIASKIKVNNADRAAADALWNDIESAFKDQRMRQSPRNPLDIPSDSPGNVKRVAELEARLSELSELSQKAEELAKKPTSTARDDLASARTEVNNATKISTNLETRVEQQRENFKSAQTTQTSRIEQLSASVSKQKSMLQEHRSNPALTSNAEKALEVVVKSEQVIEDQGKRLKSLFDRADRRIEDSAHRVRSYKYKVKTVSAGIPETIDSPAWIDVLPGRSREISQLFNQSKTEHILEAARLNPRPLSPKDVEVKNRLLAIMEEGFSEPFEQLSAEAHKVVSESKSTSAAEQILKSHAAKYEARTVPTTYLTAEEMPTEVKEFLRITTERGPPENSLRGKVNRILEDIVPTLSETRKAGILEIRPRSGSATVSEIGSALFRTASLEIFPETFLPAKDAANEFLIQISSDENLQPVLKEEFSGSKGGKKLAQNIRGLSRTFGRESVTDIVNRRPATVETQRVVKDALGLERQLANEKKISKAYEEYFEHIPSSSRRSGRVPGISAVESFDSHFPGQNPPPLDFPKFGGPTPVKPKGPTPRRGGSASLARRIEQNLSPRSKLPTSTTANISLASSRSFKRARSFTSLRGFSRIGGVLIGRELKGHSEISEITWEWNANKDKVQLRLRDRDDEWHKSRWYDPLIMELALAYAADGRPVTVTMVTASPLPELQILLHPTLVDTRVGKDAIELDRFVDTYARHQAFCEKAETRVRSAKVIFQLAWAIRILQLKEYGFNKLEGPDDVAELLGVFHLSFASASRLLERAEDLYAAAKKEVNSLKNTPVDERPQFFDPILVGWTEKALSFDGFKEFKESISKSAQAEINAAVHAAGGNDLRWLSKNAQVWREFSELAETFETELKAYNRKVEEYNRLINPASDPFGAGSRFRPGGIPSLDEYDADLNQRLLRSQLNGQLGGKLESLNDKSEWIKRNKPLIKRKQQRLQGYQELLKQYLISVFSKTTSWRMPPADFEVWSGVRESEYDDTLESFLRQDSDALPLKFMLQVAFTTPAYFNSDGKLLTDEDDDESDDKIEPWMFPQISSKIHESVMERLTKEEGQLVERMVEFTQLQRLFRNLFESNHPQVSRLIELNSDLSHHVAVENVRTARWNAHPGALERILQEQLLRLSTSIDEPDVKTQLNGLTDIVSSQLDALKKVRDQTGIDEEQWNTRWNNYVSTVRAAEKQLPAIVDSLKKVTFAHPGDKALEELLHTVNQYTLARRLRSELGVEEDDYLVLKNAFHEDNE